MTTSESSGVELMDRNAFNTIEHGWYFKAYTSNYTYEIEVSYDLDDRGDPVIEYEILNVSFDSD